MRSLGVVRAELAETALLAQSRRNSTWSVRC